VPDSPASLLPVRAERSDLHRAAYPDARARLRLTEASADDFRPTEQSIPQNNIDGRCKGAQTMMPYDMYRLHQIERAPSLAQARHADEQAARMASAVSSVFGGVTRLVRKMRSPSTAPTHGIPRPAAG
jgi:hypothetical protein